MSAIIPRLARSTAFNIFPMPKYLKIVNNNKQVAIIKPLLELANINEKIKKSNANKFIKNKKIKVDELGSVK